MSFLLYCLIFVLKFLFYSYLKSIIFRLKKHTHFWFFTLQGKVGHTISMCQVHTFSLLRVRDVLPTPELQSNGNKCDSDDHLAAPKKLLVLPYFSNYQLGKHFLFL